MLHKIDRPGRPTLLRGLAGAALFLVCGIVATGAAAEAKHQLAQAQAPAGRKSAPAQRQAQPPANPVESQLAELKKQLSITAAQALQFDAFAQVFRQNAEEMNALMQQAQQNAKRNAVDDLRVSAQFAQTEADGLKRLLPVMEALYATLSEQQKRTADQLFTSAPQPESQPQRRRQG